MIANKEIARRLKDLDGDLNRKQASDLVWMLAQTLFESIATGHTVSIQKFGNFRLHYRKGRVLGGKRLHSDKPVIQHPGWHVKFHPSQELRDACINVQPVKREGSVVKLSSQAKVGSKDLGIEGA